MASDPLTKEQMQDEINRWRERAEKAWSDRHTAIRERDEARADADKRVVAVMDLARSEAIQLRAERDEARADLARAIDFIRDLADCNRRGHREAQQRVKPFLAEMEAKR